MYKLLEEADKLTDIGKATEALKILREIENNADFTAKEGAKIAELFGAALSIQGDAERAAAAYLDAAHKDKFLRAQRGHIASYLFILHYISNIDTETLYGEMSNFENLFGDITPFSPAKYSHDKIKIGCLLTTATKSSLSNFIAPLFDGFNTNKFEIYVYTFEEKEDAFSKKIKSSVAAYKKIDIFSFYDAAKVIMGDEIDVLFDFTAYGKGGDTLSVLAYRPAPVQIIGIGWPGAVNLSFVDYILADDFLLDDKMTDIPLMLPFALCFRPDEAMLKSTRKKRGNDIRLGVFNNFMKITDDALMLWNDILDSLPNATLTLKDSAIYPERINFMENRLKTLGINKKIAVKTADENYLEDILNTDIILDTFPYTGGFMTATALVLGTPAVTLAGNRFSSKFSANILNSANLNEFIAKNKIEYKNIAIKTAEKIKTTENFHENIRKRVLNSRLLNENEYVKNIENVLSNL